MSLADAFSDRNPKLTPARRIGKKTSIIDLTGDWVEGPTAIKIRNEYVVYFDHYAPPQYYGAVRSQDLRRWEDCSKEMSFPKGQRHGTALRVSKQLAQRLLAIH